MIKAAFIDFVFEAKDKIHLENCEFTIHPPLRTPEEIIAAARGAEVLCMRDQFGKINREVLEQLPELKYIVTRSAGYDHIDLDEAKRRNIAVSNVPDYGAHMIAEHAFGLLLAAARNIVAGDRRYKQDRVFSDKGLQGRELHGKTMGVLGTGRIGKHTIRIAKGFGMDVLAHDVHRDPEAAAALGFQYATLERVLGSSDFISVHVALNDTTRHLINAESLSKVKRGAILVNTSRGGVVETQALMDALRSGQLYGAGLDVLEDEGNAYHDFAELNVVVTPHLGWYSDGAVNRILEITLGNIGGYIRGEISNRVA
ncbi:MAG: hydroxyacid dehydrogenase [Anaerolineae bacterium]|nr:hydroxyacid dehydrogenase [Anaerolineae bacterium]